LGQNRRDAGGIHAMSCKLNQSHALDSEEA
jgi:hypothetical protein